MLLAYIDPGIGSAVVQAIIAGVIGFAYAIRMYGSKIRRFLFGEKKDEKKT